VINSITATTVSYACHGVLGLSQHGRPPCQAEKEIVNDLSSLIIGLAHRAIGTTFTILTLVSQVARRTPYSMATAWTSHTALYCREWRDPTVRPNSDIRNLKLPVLVLSLFWSNPGSRSSSDHAIAPGQCLFTRAPSVDFIVRTHLPQSATSAMHGIT
jgi:hypothetical protein